MILTGKNGGYDMSFNTDSGIYQLMDNGGVIKESRSLEAIDKFIASGGKKKEKRNFKRVAVLVNKGFHSNAYEKGEATSVADSLSYRGKTEFWIVVGGDRKKESDLLLDVPENHKTIKLIAEKRSQQKTIDSEIEKLSKDYKYLTPEMMEEKE